MRAIRAGGRNFEHWRESSGERADCFKFNRIRLLNKARYVINHLDSRRSTPRPAIANSHRYIPPQLELMVCL